MKNLEMAPYSNGVCLHKEQEAFCHIFFTVNHKKDLKLCKCKKKKEKKNTSTRSRAPETKLAQIFMSEERLAGSTSHCQEFSH